jgi:hypothetical protein
MPTGDREVGAVVRGTDVREGQVRRFAIAGQLKGREVVEVRPQLDQPWPDATGDGPTMTAGEFVHAPCRPPPAA